MGAYSPRPRRISSGLTAVNTKTRSACRCTCTCPSMRTTVTEAALRKRAQIARWRAFRLRPAFTNSRYTLVVTTIRKPWGKNNSYVQGSRSKNRESHFESIATPRARRNAFLYKRRDSRGRKRRGAPGICAGASFGPGTGSASSLEARVAKGRGSEGYSSPVAKSYSGKLWAGPPSWFWITPSNRSSSLWTRS